MTDIVDAARRSEIMRRIKSKNSKPELALRRLVFALGFRYRLHDKRLPGKPDLVFRGLRKAIFVHGCFWHHHIGCVRGQIPKSKTEFWQTKLSANQQRDKQVLAALEDAGWDVLTVWECELKNIETVKDKIVAFLGPKRPNARK